MEPKTIMVRKANVVLRIAKDQENFYLQRGFSICDNRGQIQEPVKEENTQEDLEKEIRKLKKELEKAKATNTEESSEELIELQKKNEHLSDTILELKEQIRGLKKQLKDAEKRLQRYE